MLLPMNAFAWVAKPGESVSSWYGDTVNGSDGGFSHPLGWAAMLYHGDGSKGYVQYKGGQPYRHFTLTDAGGDTRWAYCIEGGIEFNTTTGGYTGSTGTDSGYWNRLPQSTQEGIMLTALYGWKPGCSLPVSGINADDFYMATQVLIWEWQQQLRFSPHYRQDNGPIGANQFYGIIAGRNAEKAYNWILDAVAAHSTIPSFTAASAAEAAAQDAAAEREQKRKEAAAILRDQIKKVSEQVASLSDTLAQMQKRLNALESGQDVSEEAAAEPQQDETAKDDATAQQSGETAQDRPETGSASGVSLSMLRAAAEDAQRLTMAGEYKRAALAELYALCACSVDVLDLIDRLKAMSEDSEPAEVKTKCAEVRKFAANRAEVTLSPEVLQALYSRSGTEPGSNKAA